MKARRVKGLDPAGPLADNAERIVRVRLKELHRFMPAALTDPRALHDMRIAAKRVRYALEVTGGCFGPYVPRAVKHLKALQDVLGAIHDCDVLLAETRGDPELAALEVHVRGRRAELLDEFAALWRTLGRKGFRARLEYAIGERPPGIMSPER